MPSMFGLCMFWMNLVIDPAAGATYRPAPGVASPIICRSGLAIEAHRGVESPANTARYGQAVRLALRSDGGAQPPTSDRGRDTSAQVAAAPAAPDARRQIITTSTHGRCP